MAVDYLWMRQRKLHERVVIFIGSAAVLGLFTGLIFPTENPIIPLPALALQIGFGVFGIAGLVFVSLFYSGLDIWNKLSIGKNACAGVAPVIPGVSLPNSPITVPLHAWLSFAINLNVHPASHGFITRKLGRKITSYGLLLLGILPIGAFVEPYEKALKRLEKEKPREALRLYAAGPASNFYLFAAGTILALVIGGLIFTPFVLPALTNIHDQSVSGVQIQKTEEKIIICGTEFEAPAHNVLFAGDKILKVDDQPIHSLSDYLTNVAGKETYDLTIDRNGFVQTYSFAPNELGRIGIAAQEIPNPDYTPPGWYNPLLQVLGFLVGFFGWLVILNFLVAVANFIPIDPFDGGKMAKIILVPYLGILKMSEEDTKKFIGRVFMGILLVLILINAAPLVIVHP